MIIAVILAGGTGRRLSKHLPIPKQFIELVGKPLLMHTAEVFDRHPDVDAIYLTCLSGWEDYVRACLARFDIAKVRDVVIGGASRRHSILATLERLAAEHSPDDIVLVHDGVRSFLSPDIVTRVIAATREHGSAVAAYPNYESILVSRDGATVSQLLPRTHLYDIQTPQGFSLRFGLDSYREAERIGVDVANEMSGGDLFALLGRNVRLVEGARINMKLTTDDDMRLWRAMYALEKHGSDRNFGGGARVSTNGRKIGEDGRGGPHPVVTEDVEKAASEADLFEGLRGANVLITGITGMMGSFLALVLDCANRRHNLDLRLFGVSRKATKFHEAFPRVAIELLEQDICRPLDCNIVFDRVVHAASPIGSRAFSKNPVEALSTNVRGALNALEKAVRDQAGRFLLMSSVEVYGDADGLLGEDTCGRLDSLNVRSCYAEGKRAAENACVCAYKQYGLETVIVRLARTYGPMMNLSSGLFVADFIRDCRDGKPIALSSDGTALRQLCYVGDAVRGVLVALARGAPGQAYNIAPDGIESVGNIAARLAALLRNGTVEKTEPEAGIAYGEFGGAAGMATDKIRALGWRAEVGLDEGLRRTLSFFGVPMK